MISRKTATVLAVVGLGLIAPLSIAFAHDSAIDDGAIDDAKSTHGHHQHGDFEGHLPATSTPNVQLISKTTLKNVVPEKIADVGVHNEHAYLAAWGSVTCKYNGIHVVDIKNPAAPKEVAFIKAKEGSYPGEGIQALYIDTPKFKGDVVLSNNEKCNEKTGFGGLNIYDVTKPSSPTVLTEGYGDDQQGAGQGKKPAHEIHSVFAWDAGAKAYAVMVDNEEGPDIDIVDISDPRKPAFVAEYDLANLTAQPAPENLGEVFLHDMIVKQIDGRWIMLVSYWDGGYVKFDVTDPANATVIADSDFAAVDEQLLEQTGASQPPEGNAHQAEFTVDNQFIIAADEDFTPYGSELINDEGTEFYAPLGTFVPSVPDGDVITAQTVYVGRSCDIDTVPPAGNGTQIAVVARGECSFTEKVANVEAAGGYRAIIIANREGADGCTTLAMNVEGNVPTVSVNRAAAYDLFDLAGYSEASCLAGAAQEFPGVALGTTGDTVDLSSYFNGWGYIRLFRAGGTGKLVQLDTYAIPEAMDESKASGFGDLSVHEVAVSSVDPARGYVSYYSGGLRVIDIINDKIVEVGRFIDTEGNNFWGVQTFMHNGEEYVAASDRDHGLYIFKVAP